METNLHQQDWNLVEEVELIYRSKIKASQRPKITSVESSYDLLKSCWDMDKIELIEQFKVVYLNRGNKVLSISDLSSGGMSGTVADPRIIFATALKRNSCAIILAHNHPSGNTRPSKQDEVLTQKIKDGGKLLDILVMDHIIISSEGYFSFADEGLI